MNMLPPTILGNYNRVYGFLTTHNLDEIYIPAEFGETRNIYLDATKAKNHLGWTPISLDWGVVEVIDYFRANKPLLVR
jgi:nucleoside-diphosphate-sugar epimerase